MSWFTLSIAQTKTAKRSKVNIITALKRIYEYAKHNRVTDTTNKT